MSSAATITPAVLWAAGVVVTMMLGLLTIITSLVVLIWRRGEKDREATDTRVTACQAHHSSAHKEMYEALEEHNGRLIRVETLLPTNRQRHPGLPAE